MKALRSGLIVIALCLILFQSARTQEPVIFGFYWPSTIWTGQHQQSIEFFFNGNGHEIETLIFGIAIQFADSNVLGPHSESSGEIVVLSGGLQFDGHTWYSEYGNGSDPDTMLMVFTDTAGVFFPEGEYSRIWGIKLTPFAPGTFGLDSISGLGFPPTVRALGAMDTDSNWLPVQWNGEGRIRNIIEAQTVIFDIQTSTGSDTLFMGVPTDIIFNLDANGNGIIGVVVPFQVVYTGANVFGNLSYSNVMYSAEALNIFISSSSINLDKWDGVGNDSIMLGAFTTDYNNIWRDSAEFFRISKVLDTIGTFHFDSILFPPANVWHALNENIENLPLEIINYDREYEVVIHTGDVNADGVITASDLIYLIRNVFLSGPNPQPCEAVGDPNCSGDVESSDIIMLVNYIFKSSTAPCDIMTLMPSIWTCPKL